MFAASQWSLSTLPRSNKREIEDKTPETTFNYTDEVRPRIRRISKRGYLENSRKEAYATPTDKKKVRLQKL